MVQTFFLTKLMVQTWYLLLASDVDLNGFRNTLVNILWSC